MVPESMPQYWLAVFLKGVRDSLDFVKQDRQGIVFAILVLVLTALWLAKRHGWKDAMTHWWRTAGEGVAIAVVAWIVVLVVHLVWEPFHLQDDLWKNRQELQGHYDKRMSDLTSCSKDLGVEKTKTGLLGDQLNAQQKLINQQQGTFNACVISLEKVVSGEPPKTTVFLHQITAKNPVVTEIILLSNRRKHFRGVLKCNQNFQVVDWYNFVGSMAMMSVKQIGMTGPNRWSVDIGEPELEANVPILLSLVSAVPVGQCSFND